MYAIYDGTHAVLFTKTETRNNVSVEVSKHSWLDWHLIPSKRPQMPPPNVKTNYVDIPGAHGHLDLSNVLTGAPRFENRTGSMDFILMNKSINSEGNPDLEKYWWERYSEIMNFLHGQVIKMQFFDECSNSYFNKFDVDVREMPEASSVSLGKTVLYLGETTANYTYHKYYRCVEESSTHVWSELSDNDDVYVGQFSNREWYWIGRVNVSGFDSQNNYSTITISYDAYPYKIKYDGTPAEMVVSL